MKQFLYMFERDGEDVLNKEGTKVASHKRAYVCAPTITKGREKAKLGDEYETIGISHLGKDWELRDE